MNLTIDDAEAAEALIKWAGQRDPTNHHIMTTMLGGIHSLQLQIPNLVEKQAATSRTLCFLTDETHQIWKGVTKLQQGAGRSQKATPAPALGPKPPVPQTYQQGYAPIPPATLLPGATSMSTGQHFDGHTHQMMMEYAQQLEHQPRPQPGPRGKTPPPRVPPASRQTTGRKLQGKESAKLRLSPRRPP